MKKFNITFETNPWKYLQNEFCYSRYFKTFSDADIVGVTVQLPHPVTFTLVNVYIKLNYIPTHIYLGKNVKT